MNVNTREVSAVVMGSSPTALYAIRELAQAGFEVAVVDISTECAFRSAHVRADGRQFVGNTDEVERWLGSRFASQHTPPVLVPTSDTFIEFILQRASRLSDRFRFAPAYNGGATNLLDKSAFHALCSRHGVATPGIWNAADRAALVDLAGQIPYPCILKPVLIHRARPFLNGKKVLLARDKEEFIEHVARMPQEMGEWMVQEIIPGPESALTLFGGYFDTAGVPRQTFTGRKLRQYPPGFGSASLVTSEPCAETLRLSVDFLQAIGFKGICGAEYKRDQRDGRLKIIEINPRPTLWFQATHDAGKRITEAAVRDLACDGAVADAAQDGSVCWRFGVKDLVSSLFYRRESGFIFPPPDVSSAAAARVRSWPVFSTRDPMPSLSEPLGYAKKAWKRR